MFFNFFFDELIQLRMFFLNLNTPFVYLSLKTLFYM
jgi:hypothetical protein